MIVSWNRLTVPSRHSAWGSVRYWTIGALVVAVCVAADVRGQTPSKADDKEDVEDLGKRLIDKAAGESDEDVMAVVQGLMDASARKLQIDFDPGGETQQVQAQILSRLDEAIKVAASRRRPRRGSQQRQQSDKRRSSKAEKQADSDAKHKKEAKDAEPGPGKQGTGSAPGDAKQGDLREVRGSWGHLPMRDREEVIQGVSERYLERYREWIERYYRALQESDE